MTLYAFVPFDPMKSDLAQRCDASLSTGFCDYSTQYKTSRLTMKTRSEQAHAQSIKTRVSNIESL